MTNSNKPPARKGKPLEIGFDRFTGQFMTWTGQNYKDWADVEEKRWLDRNESNPSKPRETWLVFKKTSPRYRDGWWEPPAGCNPVHKRHPNALSYYSGIDTEEIPNDDYAADLIEYEQRLAKFDGFKASGRYQYLDKFILETDPLLKAQLNIDSFYRGRSAAQLVLKDPITELTYNLFTSHAMDLLLKGKINEGKISYPTEWTFTKKGANYSLVPKF